VLLLDEQADGISVSSVDTNLERGDDHFEYPLHGFDR